MPEILITIYITVFGLCIGSFLNVCIYRLPASESIVFPRSRCPECGGLIKFYDNIPVLSYIILRGRCRQCRTWIPVRYALVEIITGLCALAVYKKFGLTLPTGIYFIFIAALIVVIFIDIDHKIIPNSISLPGIPICFLMAFGLPEITWQDSLIGIISGGGSLLLVAKGYQLVTKKDGMGGGDIKLLAMIGALIGWQGVIYTIYVSSIVGTIAGVSVMIARKKNFKYAIPFGPFLSIGAITYIFFGDIVTQWYFQILRHPY